MNENKTKFGVKINAYAALIFLAGLFGNIIPVLLLGGVALIMEENEWLKRMSLKAIAFVIILELVSFFILLLPDFLDVISDIMIVAEEAPSESFNKISYFFSFINKSWVIFGNIFLAYYAYQAYLGKYAKVLFVENFVNKNM